MDSGVGESLAMSLLLCAVKWEVEFTDLFFKLNSISVMSPCVYSPLHLGIVALQVMLRAQTCRVSDCLPEFNEATLEFSFLVWFTQSSTGRDRSRAGDVDAAHSRTELS